MYDPNNPNGWPQQPGQPMQGQPQQYQPQYPGYPQPGMPVPGYAQMPTGVPAYSPQQVSATTIPLPQTHAVDETALKDAYQQHRQDIASWGGDKPQFLNFPGPQGQKRWDSSVPVNFESTVTIWLCPPWIAGSNIFHPTRSHFWKSYTKPQGQGCACSGTGCLICKAREAAMNQPDDALKQRAKDSARVRTRFLYNVIVLDNLAAHYDQNGMMKPFILAAGANLHAAIGDIIEARGAMRIVDPIQGRPLRLKKKKTGPMEQNVEYSLVDLEPVPLPAQFYPALANLWTLTDLDREPTQADLVAAINEMGLPMPGMAPGGQMAMPHGGGMPQPNPAYESPYQPPMQQFGQPPMQQFGQPPMQQFGQPPMQQFGQPPMQQFGQPPRQGYAGPPNMAPPPVQSTTAQSSYSPHPSQSNAGVAQTSQAPQMTAQVSPLGNVPPPPDVTRPPARQPMAQATGRPDGRDRCFGKYDPNSNLCNDCPPDMKPQCVVSSNQAISVPQQSSQTLDQLQSQLQGK
jgi:hypothetical protein